LNSIDYCDFILLVAINCHEMYGGVNSNSGVILAMKNGIRDPMVDDILNFFLKLLLMLTGESVRTRL